MRNLDRLRIMPVDQLAAYLVETDMRSKTNMSDNFQWTTYYFSVWKSPSGKEYENIKDALDDCIKWLNEESGE